jgi:ribose transport system substrate-binding protein
MKKMYKILCLLFCALTLCGCVKSKKIKLAFVTNATADFWLYAQAGIQQLESEFDDVEIIFKVGDGTTATQKQLVDDLLSLGIQGLAISPVTPKDQKRMINDWAKKIKVLCVDSDAPDSKRIAYLGTDNVAAGRACGEMVKAALPNGGDIMVFVGLADAQNAVERYRGLKEVLKGTDINVLGLQTDEGKASKARTNAEAVLIKYPKIAALVGLWGYNTPANYGAVKDAGKLGKVQLIGFDEDPTTLKAIDEGYVYGTVVQNPYKFGYESMKALRALILEKKSLAEAGIPESKIVFVKTRNLKKGEGEQYKKHCAALKAGIK